MSLTELSQTFSICLRHSVYELGDVTELYKRLSIQAVMAKMKNLWLEGRSLKSGEDASVNINESNNIIMSLTIQH